VQTDQRVMSPPLLSLLEQGLVFLGTALLLAEPLALLNGVSLGKIGLISMLLGLGMLGEAALRSSARPSNELAPYAIIGAVLGTTLLVTLSAVFVTV
jgi:hypothetical protein